LYSLKHATAALTTLAQMHSSAKIEGLQIADSYILFYKCLRFAEPRFLTGWIVSHQDKMPLETTAWDPIDNLTSTEAERAYLEAAFEDGDPALIAAVIGDIARARGMTQIAKDAGLTRDTMYKAFRREGNPTLETLTSVLKALGLKLAAVQS
jgi:probable addiction module antidote protein